MVSKVQLLEPITEDVRTRVFENHGTSAEIQEENVKKISEWARNQPHLPETPPDEIILRFLLLSKFRVEETKMKLDLYYSIRGKAPEVFDVSNPNTEKMMNYVDNNYMLVFPKLTPDLHRIALFKLTSSDPDKFDPYMFFAWTLDLNEIRLFEDFFMSNIIISDFEHANVGHLMKMSPMMMKKAVTFLEKVYTSSVKGIHFINCPPIADRFLKALKAVVNPKIASRFYVHDSLEALYEHVPRSFLPVDYGGSEKSLDELREIHKLKMREYKDRFDALDTLRVDENARPGDILDDELFGVYGNFKKLDLD